MKYRMIIQAVIDTKESEIIGAKEAISEALELMGCDVEYVGVNPAEVE